MKPGNHIRVRKSNTMYTVIALTESGNRAWVINADAYHSNGGLVWHGKTGEKWKSWAEPQLVPVDDCAVIR